MSQNPSFEPRRREAVAWLAAAALTPSLFAAPALAQSGGTLEAEILRQGGGADLLAFYAARGWSPAWSAAEAAGLARALAEARRHGLDAGRFAAPLDAGAPAEALEVRLTRAALAYGGALAHGLADPRKLHAIFTLPLNRVDLAAGLAAALAGSGVEAWLASLAPTEAAYGRLCDAYLATTQEAPAAAPEIPEGPAIRPGDGDPRLPAVRAALARKGWSPPPAADLAVFDPGLERLLRAFQEREGLKVDGVIGPDTLEALNEGPFDRARRIALNLERWRWLARGTAPTRIDVNTAAASLAYYRDGRLVRRVRTVVGRADRQTPALSAGFDRLVVNPPWRVPASIARREILPRGEAYLRRNRMTVSGGRVIQLPGPGSALGLVKFDMRNPYAIYLHDTPAKALFEGNDRHRSHGCVRVEDAVGFARLLAEERGRGAEFERALASGRTATVALGEAIPVRLLYRTAFVSDGEVRFAPDHYGRDEALAAALGLPSAKRPHPLRRRTSPSRERPARDDEPAEARRPLRRY